MIDSKHTSLAPLLEPSTKEIVKIKANVLQQIEMKRWDASVKLQTYKSGTGVFHKQIQCRPTIVLLKAQEGLTKSFFSPINK